MFKGKLRCETNVRSAADPWELAGEIRSQNVELWRSEHFSQTFWRVLLQRRGARRLRIDKRPQRQDG